MKKVLVFVGTRPEAIKMAPLVLKLKESGFEVVLGLSGQHADMVSPILEFFDLEAGFNLQISKEAKYIEDPLSLITDRLSKKLRSEPVDLILVHGDTSTTLGGALSGFYLDIPVGHIEAGLRSGNMKHPFPEEANRKLVASLSTYHFAPTDSAKKNLLREGVPESQIYLTGNTIIDAVFVAKKILRKTQRVGDELKNTYPFLRDGKKKILVTAHRRENLNESIVRIIRASKALAQSTGAQAILPIHPNPKIREILGEELEESDSFKVINPLDFSQLVWLYSQLDLIITDSGGIQEESTVFNIPVLVTRKVTERKESISSGRSHLVADSEELIFELGKKSLEFSGVESDGLLNPYGDGKACERIANILSERTYDSFHSSQYSLYQALKKLKEYRSTRKKKVMRRFEGTVN